MLPTQPIEKQAYQRNVGKSEENKIFTVRRVEEYLLQRLCRVLFSR